MPTLKPPQVPRVSDPEVDRALTLLRDRLTQVTQEIERLKQVPGWIYVPAAAFQNSWVNFNTAPDVTNAAYWKDPFGRVYVRGLIKSGAVGSAAFTLPVGYRPMHQVNRATTLNTTDTDAAGRLIVETDGSVKPFTGTNTFAEVYAEFWTT